VRAHLRPLDELTELDLTAWRDLAANAVEPNPFFEADFVLAAWEHLGRNGVGLLVAEDADGWAACLPVHRPARWRRLPIATLATWRHLYCFLGTPLVAADRTEDALATMIDGGLRERRVNALTLDWLGDGGPVAASLERHFGERGIPTVRYERFERASLERRTEPTYLDDTLRGHRRRELQRMRRALARDVGDPVTTTDRPDDPEALEDFLRIEASGWKGERGTALASREDHARFFRAVCTAFAAADRLQLLELNAGGRAVALQCNLLANGTVFHFKIGYDAQYARYSPGLQLEREAVDLFHGRTSLKSMDSCADPNNQMINRLWPDRRPITTIVVGRRGPRGWATRQATSASASLRDLVRRVRWKES
jgi:CelD/BcsL family acetyltransferase involved in cellulose biosynthesis